jgi:hypothetical protein
MTRSNRWVSFITKLNEQTQAGKIRWRSGRDNQDLLASHFQQYGPVYSAELDDATVRIYKEKLKKMTLDEEEYWEDSVELDIKTADGPDFIRIRSVSGIEDLYETVAYKANKVDEFLNKFLSEP